MRNPELNEPESQPGESELSAERATTDYETDGDMDFNQALDYLEKKYGNDEASEDAGGHNQALQDSINRARNGESTAYGLILQFISAEKTRLGEAGPEDEQASQKIRGLEKVRVAIEVQNDRDRDNSTDEAYQQLRIQRFDATVAKEQESQAKGARAEIYTSIYPPSKTDFNNEAVKLAGKYRTNWQQLIGGVDFAKLTHDNPVKATATYLMVKNAVEHDVPYVRFEQDYNNLMREATDHNRTMPKSNVGRSEVSHDR